MPLTKEKTQEIITKYGKTPENTGQTEAQIALFTAKIQELTGHLKEHTKDHHSRRGLLKMVGQRRRVVAIRSSQKREIIKELGIRR
jgi:small subunit ribosomal protein S15